MRELEHVKQQIGKSSLDESKLVVIGIAILTGFAALLGIGLTILIVFHK